MERKALGKGIGALIPKKELDPSLQAAANDPGLLVVDIGRIKPNPLQPREEFDDEGIKELSESIREKGVIQPLLARRIGDNFELIAGERRLRAAKSLNLKEIPIILKDIREQESLELALIENIQRENLNPIEEARAYQFLLDKYNVTQENISKAMGKARATIANSLRLLRLPKEIQDEIKKSRISYAHGRALLEIEDQNQQRKIAQEIISKGLSVRETENLIKQRRGKSSASHKHKPPAVREPMLSALEHELQRCLATKVRVVERKKRGHVVIDYYSREDLKRIVNRITGGKE